MPQINKVAREHFIDNLRSRADGETVVDMAKEFGRATLDVISVVSAYDNSITFSCIHHREASVIAEFLSTRQKCPPHDK